MVSFRDKEALLYGSLPYVLTTTNPLQNNITMAELLHNMLRVI